MKRSILLATLALALAAPALGQGSNPPPEGEFAAMIAAQNAYYAKPDNAGTGGQPAIKEMVRSLPDHTVYRPANLADIPDGSLGVIGWGNGGCSPDGASARFHLLELASHGYVAIAPGKILSGPGLPLPPPPEPGELNAETSSTQVMQGIEWALAENERPGSPLYRLLDPTKIAVSGFSCGGVQALDLARDPRVKAVVIHNSGIFPDGTNPMSGLVTEKAWLDGLHTPVIYILGGPTDIAHANGMDDFARISKVPVAVANLDVGHGGTFMEPDGGAAAKVAVAWLEWQLRGDAQAAAMFTGEDCGLCKDEAWTFERKNFDKLEK